MLYQHDPAIGRHHKVEYFFDLCTSISESILHHFARYMALLIGKQNNTRALDVCAFEGFDPPRKAVVEYRKANNAFLVLICHVSALILCSRAQLGGIALIFWEHCVLIIKDQYIPPPDLGL